jgi:hypothetical protein
MSQPTLAPILGVATGRFLRSSGTSSVFSPNNTTYELTIDGPSVPLNTSIRVTLVAVGRKVLTMPSGGNFVSPIQGPPRVVQGRVLAIEGDSLVVQAGVPIRIKLPADESAVDLNNGSIAVGQTVNVTLRPGVTFTLA